MRLLVIPALLFNLCGTSGGRVGEVVGEVHQGQGWSMRLPAPLDGSTTEPFNQRSPPRNVRASQPLPSNSLGTAGAFNICGPRIASA